MDTPWGDLPVSDAHVHFFSHRFFSILAEQKQAPVESLGPLLGWNLPPPDPVLPRSLVRMVRLAAPLSTKPSTGVSNGLGFRNPK